MSVGHAHFEGVRQGLSWGYVAGGAGRAGHMMPRYRAAANIVHTGTSDQGLPIVEVAGGVVGFEWPGIQPILVEEHRSLRRLLETSLIGKEAFGMRVCSATIQDHLRLQQPLNPEVPENMVLPFPGPATPGAS